MPKGEKTSVYTSIQPFTSQLQETYIIHYRLPLRIQSLIKESSERAAEHCKQKEQAINFRINGHQVILLCEIQQLNLI